MEYFLQVKLKQGLKAAMAISSEGNTYLQVNIVIGSFESSLYHVRYCFKI